jgi:hypothetical protein
MNTQTTGNTLSYDQVVKSAGGDYHSASVLSIIKGKRVFIVFDYIFSASSSLP